MDKNKAKVTFRDSADGFHYSYSMDSKAGSYPHPPANVLCSLLGDAARCGAAQVETELVVRGFGPVRWSYVVDKEVLRDLLKEAMAS